MDINCLPINDEERVSIGSATQVEIEPGQKGIIIKMVEHRVEETGRKKGTRRRGKWRKLWGGCHGGCLTKERGLSCIFKEGKMNGKGVGGNKDEEQTESRGNERSRYMAKGSKSTGVLVFSAYNKLKRPKNNTKERKSKPRKSDAMDL